MKTGWSLVCLAVLGAGVVAPAAAGESAVKMTPAQKKRWDECSQQRTAQREKYSNDLRAQRDAWAAMRDKCAGTGAYEFLMGTLENSVGNEAAAAAEFEAAVNRHLPEFESSYIALTTVRFRRAARRTPPDVAEARKVAAELVDFVDKHPNDGFAAQEAAKQHIELRDWEAAIRLARVSLKAEPSFWMSRRSLVLALHQTNRCPEAIAEIEPARRTAPELDAHLNFMLAAIDCYAETGHYDEGEQALRALVRANPQSRDNPQVAQLEKYFVYARSKAKSP